MDSARVRRVQATAAISITKGRTAHKGADVAVRPLVRGDQLLLHVLPQWRRPQRHVACISAEDALVLAVRQAQVRVRQYKLAHVGIEREARHARAQRQHQHRAARVHAVAGGGELRARLAHVESALAQHFFRRVVVAHDALALRVDAEDGAGGDGGVDVAGPVDRVERGDVAARPRESDRVSFLFRHQHAALAAAAHGVDEDVVGQHVQLLLRVAAGVRLRRSQARHPVDGRARHQGADAPARGGDGGEQQHQLGVANALALSRQQPRRQQLAHAPRRRRNLATAVAARRAAHAQCGAARCAAGSAAQPRRAAGRRGASAARQRGNQHRRG